MALKNLKPVITTYKTTKFYRKRYIYINKNYKKHNITILNNYKEKTKTS